MLGQHDYMYLPRESYDARGCLAQLQMRLDKSEISDRQFPNRIVNKSLSALAAVSIIQYPNSKIRNFHIFTQIFRNLQLIAWLTIALRLQVPRQMSQDPLTYREWN